MEFVLLCYFLFMVFSVMANNRKDKKAIKGLIKIFEVCCRFAKKQGISLWLGLRIIADKVFIFCIILGMLPICPLLLSHSVFHKRLTKCKQLNIYNNYQYKTYKTTFVHKRY